MKRECTHNVLDMICPRSFLLIASIANAIALNPGGGAGGSIHHALGGDPNEDSLRAMAGPVVVSGATGRTGSLLFMLLREAGIEVRALVRNRTKAQEMLDCGECGEDQVRGTAMTESFFTGQLASLPPMHQST